MCSFLYFCLPIALLLPLLGLIVAFVLPYKPFAIRLLNFCFSCAIRLHCFCLTFVSFLPRACVTFTKVAKLLKFLAVIPQTRRKPGPLFFSSFSPRLRCGHYQNDPPVGAFGPGPRLAGDLALSQMEINLTSQGPRGHLILGPRPLPGTSRPSHTRSAAPPRDLEAISY